jgi:predicted TIM-barrel fold metal-dependent hydrolase
MSETNPMATPGTTKAPIVNCHVHIFTGDHVPAHLAKSILPWPVFYLVNIRWVLGLMVWLKQRTRFVNKPWWKTFTVRLDQFRVFIWHNRVLKFLRFVLHAWVLVNVIVFALDQFVGIGVIDADTLHKWLTPEIRSFLLTYGLLWRHMASWLIVLFGAYLYLLVPSARRVFVLVLGLFWTVLGRLPGKQIKELWDRYKLIVRFSLYGVARNKGKDSTGEYEEEEVDDHFGQRYVLQALQAQYPMDSQFVILPMDMEYMGAGPVASNGGFHDQMAELVKLKAAKGPLIHPFIFIDPRRILKEGETFFSWEQDEQGLVLLKPCKVKEYLDAGCRGFKIYPALGYYPFDEALLPLWLYAAQNQIPIMTHCIKGVIYYRGRKLRDWDAHPVFMRQKRKRAKGEDASTLELYEALDLLQTNNEEFSWNFTHPLNYLCLLNEDLLRLLVAKCDKRVQELFGYSTAASLTRDLSQLKICMAHFGGDDEWHRHMESDTNAFNQQLSRYPHRGLDFKILVDGKYEWNRLEKHWEEVDWYTIICSLIQQYPNVYADISYILHEEKIRPLLVKTLDHPLGRLPERVLFGTDFYVVRNHNSDKELLAEMQAGLSEAHFDRIARENPVHYYTCSI